MNINKRITFVLKKNAGCQGGATIQTQSGMHHSGYSHMHLAAKILLIMVT